MRTYLDSGLVLGVGSTELKRMDSIQRILWPRGWALRAEELQALNPYSGNLPAAPDLLRTVVTNKEPALDVSAPNAAIRIRALLAERGSAQVIATPEVATVLADPLVDLSTEPVTTEYLQGYPRISEIEPPPDDGSTGSTQRAAHPRGGAGETAGRAMAAAFPPAPTRNWRS